MPPEAVIEEVTLEEVLAKGAPTFFETDPAAILAKAVAKYEELTQRTLYEGQAEKFLLETIAYMLALRAEEEQAAIEQCLIAFSAGGFLDVAAANNSTYRLLASHARTTIRFTLAAAAPVALVIPAGTRVGAEGGTVTFATEAPLVIPAGALSGDVLARCTAAGIVGNGWPAGTVAAILDPVAGVASAANVDISGEGSDVEGDDRLRSRAAHANEKLSGAGPRAGYRERVRDVNPSIVDVAVVRPSPGVINIFPLMAHGQPTDGEREEILAALDAESVRPQGDEVFVLAPVPVAFDVALLIRVDRMPAELVAAATVAARAVTDAWAQKLGGAIAPSEILAAVKALAGVVDCETDLDYAALAEHQVRVCGAITVDVEMTGGSL